MEINFDQKTFLLVENSEVVIVNADTVFEYSQQGNMVTAVYHGGAIQRGNILATLKGQQLHMVYICLTKDGELKSGKAVAEITIIENNKLKLSLQWQWLNDTHETGTSDYIEW